MKHTNLLRMLALALCLVLCVQPASALMSVEEYQASKMVNRDISGLCFPMEAEFYARIVDYVGCRGAEQPDLLYGRTNSGCTNPNHAYTPNDGLDISANYGDKLYAPGFGNVYSYGDRIVVAMYANDSYSYYLILEGAASCTVSDGTFVNAGDHIGYAAGNIHYLGVMDTSDRGSAIASDAGGCLTGLRSNYLLEGTGSGLINVNPAPSYSAAGNSLTGSLAGPSYSFPTAPVQQQAHAHAWDAGTILSQPTETSSGLIEYTCTECGEKLQETMEPLAHTEHQWDGGVVISQATETSQGVIEYTCTVCGEKRQEYTAQLAHTEHQWNGGVVISQATETTQGVIEYTCTICGQTRQEYTAQLPHTEHQWNSGVVISQATETTQGVIEYTCTICGQTRQEYTAMLEHTKHSWGPAETIVPASHTSTGTVRYTCTFPGCGATYEETIPANSEHVFDQQIPEQRYLLSEANCTSAAVYYKSCICGERGYETFSFGDPKGHTFADGWSYDSTQHWRSAICGHDVRAQVGEHTWNEGSVTTPATSTTYGVKTYTCWTCGAQRTEQIAPSVHQHTFATEWSRNDFGHWHAATCGDTQEVSSYGQHQISTSSNVQWYNGVQHQVTVYSCLVCGWSQTELVHSYTQQNASSTYLKSQATCTSPAVYYKSCVCGEKGTETFTYGSSGGHTYGTSWSSDASYHWRTCSVCGTRGEIAAHSYGSNEKCTVCGYGSADAHVHTSHLTRVVKKEATCTTDGNIGYYTCSCGKWFTDTTALTEITDHQSVIVPATGHVDANKDGRCDVCRQQIASQQVEYQMMEGAGYTWMTNSNQGLVFRSSADYAKFDHVEVDGATVLGSHYTVSAGSTIVELSATYLKQLSEGSHTIAVVSSDGKAEAGFTVRRAAAEQSGSGVWVVVAVIAVVAVVAAAGVAAYLFFSSRNDGGFGGGKQQKKKGGKFAR